MKFLTNVCIQLMTILIEWIDTHRSVNIHCILLFSFSKEITKCFKRKGGIFSFWNFSSQQSSPPWKKPFWINHENVNVEHRRLTTGNYYIFSVGWAEKSRILFWREKIDEVKYEKGHLFLSSLSHVSNFWFSVNLVGGNKSGTWL